MDRKIRGVILGIGLTILLAGCMNTFSEKKSTLDQEEAQYASVQEYKGEGYSLKNGDENDKIAEAKCGEVEKAVKDFFLEKYKTEIEVRNLVGNADGMTVFVESTGPVHFYSYAIVPINQETKEIMSEDVMSQEDVVEEGIREGLYRLIFDDEFQNLEEYLDEVVSDNKVTGRTVESLQKVGGSGVMTPYYTMTSFYGDEAIQPVFELYMKNPDAKKEDLKRAFNEDLFAEEYLNINIILFMKEERVSPSKSILEKVSNDLESMDTIPKGTYQIIVNDNGVHKETSEGYKENSIMTELIKSK
ncbi:DUF1672 domain-containing protein [Rossellomorea vietnamensis]|uniref:DUF1672 domain-containing protein n=1 Tax=Rossellomorea vietnamensis TaxID=218284 RepID=A0ACD4C494_9BACI|nr:DUF1672 domain-containing protein [Rossellomorea vietnamensis]UXH43328.1 DUF1672 domain-containing protein [Rossellomorea vietnamensis]